MSQLGFVLLSFTAFGLDVSVYSADFYVRIKTKCSEMSFYWLICQCFGRPYTIVKPLSSRKSSVLDPEIMLNALRITLKKQ